MPTAAQTQANRANARHSTGPQSAAGKARSSQNARTHGLTAKGFVILPGQQQAFSDLSENLRAEVQPQGALQELVFQTLLHAAWTLHRCRQAEADLYTRSEDPTLDPLISPACATQLRLLDTYTRRAERAFHKSLNELRTLQTDAAIRSATRTNEAKSPRSTLAPSPTYTADSLLDRIYQDIPQDIPDPAVHSSDIPRACPQPQASRR